MISLPSFHSESMSDNLTWDTKPGDNLIEYEEGNSLPIVFNCRHGLNPIIKVVDDHDYVLIPPNQSWVAIYEVHPPLDEGTDDNDWVKRGWMRAHFSSEHQLGLTLLNHFNTIFKDKWLEITGSQKFMGHRKAR
jgi:hypothetical protein